MNEINNKKNIVSYIMVLFIGALIMYAVVYFFPTSITENVTKLEKDVTVTDTGIADAIEKTFCVTVCNAA